ncbi:hypothetical protein EV421DRAFT_1740741 [Armillaria borealis]|uniref:Uncharacterized protein n=1 Tax=Armillaria borealis TaxID=47425 RepID=A0AA39MHP5_9AGAR|nr:hypothetical protein EV421DRAFT_1740741 [Armillaria borealis]
MISALRRCCMTLLSLSAYKKAESCVDVQHRERTKGLKRGPYRKRLGTISKDQKNNVEPNGPNSAPSAMPSDEIGSFSMLLSKEAASSAFASGLHPFSPTIMTARADLSGYHAAFSIQPPLGFTLNSEQKGEQSHLHLQLQTCSLPPIFSVPMPMVPNAQAHHPFYEAVPNGQFSFCRRAGPYLCIP